MDTSTAVVAGRTGVRLSPGTVQLQRRLWAALTRVLSAPWDTGEVVVSFWKALLLPHSAVVNIMQTSVFTVNPLPFCVLLLAEGE